MWTCVGDEEVDKQLRLRDDTIFRLKQEISTQQQRIEELKYENDELKSQLSLAIFKEEGMFHNIII